MINSYLKRICLSITIITLSSFDISAQCGGLHIAGVIDGPLPGGIPKAIQVCANADITDLSIYGLGAANNGGGTDGEEYTFPAISLSAGECLTIATETTAFGSFFGCPPTYVDGTAPNINGDDAIELFCNSNVEDLYGDINQDGTGQAWEYQDSWAVATDALPSPIFNISDWNVSPPNSLDGETSNATAATPYPNTVCGNCAINSITAGTQTACDPLDNTYSQEITVDYTDPPMGMIVINGQSYAVTSSPQTITLAGLIADGNPVSIDAMFDANPLCSLTAINLFTAPASCATIPQCEISQVYFTNYSCNDDNTINFDVCFNYTAPQSSQVAVFVDDVSQGMFNYPFTSPGCISLENIAKNQSGVLEIVVSDASTANGLAAYFSEFHYDNVGTDSGEFIEVSAVAGTDLNGWEVVLYNGSNGTDYNTIPLSGIIPNSGSGCGTFLINLPTNGLQNGSPDGFALVNAMGGVEQFLSYEGTLTASTGPAAGMTSTDVGVAEGGGTNIGASIALTGSGWNTISMNTAGMFNPTLDCTMPCMASAQYAIPSIAPQFLCPSDKVIQLSPGLCGELSRQAIPGVVDDCGGFTSIQVGGPTSTDFLDIFNSPYTYEYEVTDSDGNVSSCSYDVEIIPYQNPTSTLSCNDHVNITANLDCEIDFTADMMLEGGPYGCYDLYQVTAQPSSLGQNTFEVTVTDPNTGLECWGYVTVEDKTDPVIDCEICPPVNGNSASDYNPDCVLNCYEQPILQLNYDDGLRDDLIQEDYDDFVEDAITDNCDNYDAEDVSFYDQYTSLGACVGTRLTRVWTVGFERADGSRGTVSCTREYFFRPLDLVRVESYALDGNGNPMFEAFEDALVLPPEIVELPCGVDVSPQGITAFFDDPTSVDRDTDDNNIDPDELDVDLVIENNEGFRWAYPHYYQDGVGSGGPHAQAINNEICNIITGYTDSEIDACAPGCYGNRKVLRNWTVLDWCTAQFVTYGQIIKSIDQNPPSLTLNDVTVSVDPWNCEAAVRLPAPEHIFDDCDNDVTYTIGNRSGFGLSGNATDGFVLQGVGLGTHTVEYKSEDCCGNVGRATMTVTVVDNTPPIAVSKEFIVIGLTNIGNTVDEFQGVAKLHAEDVDNGSYDGCSDVTLSVRRTPVCDADDAEWGPFVSFCCEDLNGGTQANIDVELRILDENGNENIVWATVLLEDKTATIPQMPPHMFLTCDMDYNNLEMTGGIPRFFGACGEAQIECDTLEVYENTEPDELRASDGVIIDGIGPIEAPAYDPSCGFGAIRRQFRDCGGGVQWFVILPVDPFDASTIVWPQDVVVDCDDYETGEPSWEEATCNLVGVSMKADTFLFEDGACYKILNHWSVINWCTYDPTNPSAGGKYEYTQTIKIIDTVDPVLTVEDSLCFAVTTDCVSSDVSLSGSATDDGDCGSEWISWDVSIDAYADWTEDFHYATTNPRLLPNGEPNPYHIAKTGNGEAATITLPDGIPSSKIWHRAVWRAFDGCGNTSSVTRYFQIVDKKAPTPYCLNLSTAVMSNGQVELWAIDFNVGSFDNCTDSDNLLFTFTDVAPPPRDDTEYDSNSDLMWYNGTFWYYDSTNGDYESQDDYGGDTHRWEPGLRSAGKVFTASDADASGFAQVPIYVWDECGNKDFCLVNLRLVDNGGGGMAMVSGQVVTEFGEEVEQVLTELDGPLNFRETDVTDAQGEYAFTNTPFYADYQVRGEKNDDYLNGVSTLDLIIIQRHILSIESLDSPYKMIAADANSDNEVSALDLIELRKLILGIYDELPENGSWKFINADNTLSIENPWNYSETRSIEDLAADMMTEDFVGVKIGDLNGTAQANARMSANEVSATAKAVEVSYEDRVVKEGDLVEISFTTDRSDIYGYQFTLNTPGLELVEAQGVKAENIAVFEDRLTMSYNKTQAIDAGTLVTLVMRAKTSARVSDLLDMGSELTQAEAYVGSGLDVVNINLADQQEAGEFALYQNEPNPFSDNTTIGFKLPEAGQANITLYDVTGKVLKVIQGQYERGYNTVRVTKEELGVSGMIYYRLQAGDEVLTKHMILIE